MKPHLKLWQDQRARYQELKHSFPWAIVFWTLFCLLLGVIFGAGLAARI